MLLLVPSDTSAIFFQCLLSSELFGITSKSMQVSYFHCISYFLYKLKCILLCHLTKKKECQPWCNLYFFRLFWIDSFYSLMSPISYKHKTGLFAPSSTCWDSANPLVSKDLQMPLETSLWWQPGTVLILVFVFFLTANIYPQDHLPICFGFLPTYTVIALTQLSRHPTATG